MPSTSFFLLAGLAMVVGNVLGVAGVAMANRWLDAQAVRRAVAFEVAEMRWQAAAMAAEIARRYRAGEPLDAGFFRAWRLSAPHIYPSIGAGIARLSPAGLQRVGYFHAQLAAARERVAIAEREGGFHPSPYRVLSCLVRAVNEVQPWVQPHLGVSTGSPPDMADANALLGELEARGDEPIAMAYIWADSCALPDDPAV